MTTSKNVVEEQIIPTLSSSPLNSIPIIPVNKTIDLYQKGWDDCFNTLIHDFPDIITAMAKLNYLK